MSIHSILILLLRKTIGLTPSEMGEFFLLEDLRFKAFQIQLFYNSKMLYVVL